MTQLLTRFFILICFVTTSFFALANIGQDQAQSMIEHLPAVHQFCKKIIKSNREGKMQSKCVADVEDGGHFWSVHIYEYVNDGNNSGHSATFGWYQVDKKTGKIKKFL